MNTSTTLWRLVGALSIATAATLHAQRPQPVEPTGLPGDPPLAPADDERDITGDPAEEFLKAYMQAQKAESLEREGQLQKALVLYRGAAEMITGLASRYPTWQPLIVEYRGRRIAEAMTSLKQRLGKTADDILSRPEPGIATGGESPDVVLPSAPGTPPATASASPDPLLKQLQDRLWALQQKLSDSEQTRRELEQRLGATTGQVRELAKKLEESDRIQAQLRERLALLESGTLAAPGVETQPASDDLKTEIASLKQQLAATVTDRDNALALTKDLNARLESTIKERDAAIAQIAQFKELEQKYQQTLAENAELTKRLEEVSSGTGSPQNRDEEIAGLQSEISRLKDEITAAQRQNADYENTIAELQVQLDNSSAQLAQYKLKGVSPEEIDRIATENTLLRDIITRQLQSQARRDQARRVMLEQLSKYQVETETMKEQLDFISEPLVDMNEEEKNQLAALLREPVIRITESTSEPDLEISIAAEKSDKLIEESGTTIASSVSGTGGTASSGTGTAAPAIDTGTPAEFIELAKEARSAFDAENFREAERIYEKILSKSPKSLFALSNLGVVYFRTRKFKAAEMMLKKAIEIEPKDAFSYQTLGIVYYQQGRFDEAMEVLTKALDINPRNAVAHNYLGITASRKGWPEAAEKEILEAIAINPDYADAHFNLAVVYAMNEPPSIELARRHYRKALDLGAAPDEALENMLK